MKIEVTKIELTKPSVIPAGVYRGTRSGYAITLPVMGGEFKIWTKDGIRGFCDVTVEVDESGKIEIKQ